MTYTNSNDLQIDRNLLQRIFSKVVVNRQTGCWEWQAHRDAGGYGRFGVKGYARLAHRVIYELFVEPVPHKLYCDHLCRVRHCVNPAHIEIVTQRENILRGIGTSAVNAKRTHCKHGHELSDENLIIRTNGNRLCRACNDLQKKTYYARHKEQEPEALSHRYRKYSKEQRERIAALPDDHPRKIAWNQKKKEQNAKVYQLPYDHPKRVAAREYGKEWRKRQKLK